MSQSQAILRSGKRGWRSRFRNVRQNAGLLLLFAPVFVYIIIFRYIPMSGILIAFKDFKPALGIFSSPWTSMSGMKYFNMFFTAYNFKGIVGNTLTLSLYSMLAGFPLPIVFALLLTHLEQRRFKKIVQTVTYAPHFISMVVMVGMLYIFLAPSSGLVNNLLKSVGMKPVMFLTDKELFPHMYVLSGVWQHTGWDSVLYIAALSSVNPELHEAAVMDGATKPQRILHIDLPSILPTAVIMLILNTGSIMSIGFEKVYLMQNTQNLAASEVLSTYIYKIGLLNGQYSLSVAVGLFNSVINFSMLLLVNFVSRRVVGSSLW